MKLTKQIVTKSLTFIVFPLMGMVLLTLAGCGAGGSDSGACTTTTQTDANGNPISTVGCNSGGGTF